MRRFTRTFLLCLIAITVLCTGAAQSRVWQYEYPVASGGLAGLWPSIKADSGGNLYVSYVGHGKLMLASYSGAWSTEVANESGIASGEAPQWTSLAMAGTQPHIAYHDSRTKTLKHAWKSSGSWQYETVHSAAGVGKYSSIAVNGSGYPAITYYDETNNALKYAYQDGSGWHIETIATGCGRYSSLAFDGSGYAHVAYYDAAKHLIYAKRSSSWTYETADSAKFRGEMCSLVLNASGYPCIAYRDAFLGRLLYAYKDGSGWHIEVADSQDRTGFTPALAVGSDGYPRINYYRRAGYSDGTNWYALETWYAYKTAGGWQKQMIERIKSTNDQWAMSMVLDSSNRPCVAYHYFASKSLNYMRFNGSSWTQQVVDYGREVGQYASLTLDASNNPHISYYAMDNPSVYYTRRSGSSWVVEQVDATSDTGAYTSIQILPSGYPAVTYGRFKWNWVNSECYMSTDLKYAYRDASGWHPSGVQNDVGLYNSLALLGGYPAISYGDFVSKGMNTRYTQWNGSSWQFAIADPGSPPDAYNPDWHADGLWTSMAYDQYGNPHISYMRHWEDYGSTPPQNVYLRSLMHAWRVSGTWYYEIVEDGQAGKFSSIAINSAGYPCIAYQDVENGYLKYAWKTPSGWQIETVDTSTATGWYASLDLDSAGYPHIAYKEIAGSCLRYAWKDASGWHTETVDNSGRVGDYCSLRLTSADSPTIAYMDWDNLTLKLASPGPQDVGAISGYVKDTSNNAISGATVSTNTGGYTTTSAANGSYTLSNVAVGTYNVTATKTGYNPQTQNGVSVSVGQTTTCNFSLSVVQPGAISGYVKDAGNNAISGATVSTSTGGYSTTSAANGSYTLSNVAVGTYAVTASKTGYQSQTNTGVTVTSGQTTTSNFSLSLLPSELVQNGSFEGGFTSGVGNAWTSFQSASYGPTFADGTDQFKDGVHSQKITMPQPSSPDKYAGVYQRLSTVTGTEYTLTVWERAQCSESYNGEHLVCRVGIDLTGGTDFTSGNVSWQEINAVKNTWVSISRTFTATGPNVTIFLQGWRKWVAAGTGYVWFDAVTCPGPSGPTTGTISGYVKDTSNNAISGATVSTNTGGYTTTSAADGSYTLSNVAPGTYDVTASKTGYQSQTQTNKTVTAGQTTTVNFNLSVSIIASEDFTSMPSWSSSYDASWGSAAAWSIVSGGQSGNFLQAVRSSQGSSAKAKVYTVPANTNISISVYMKCPSYAGAYWMECAYRLGSYTAQDFDQNGGSWTLIKKFSDSGTNGNGNTWTKYTVNVNTGSNTQISIGYKLGSYACSGPTVGWDTFRIE